jgi:hypothetical protein
MLAVLFDSRGTLVPSPFLRLCFVASVQPHIHHYRVSQSFFNLSVRLTVDWQAPRLRAWNSSN